MSYTIINTLVTDIDPDIQVKNAMNRINAADREKQLLSLKQKHQEYVIEAKAKQKQKVRDCRVKVLLIKEEK
jgi:hypothetical protein